MDLPNLSNPNMTVKLPCCFHIIGGQGNYPSIYIAVMAMPLVRLLNVSSTISNAHAWTNEIPTSPI